MLASTTATFLPLLLAGGGVAGVVAFLVVRRFSTRKKASDSAPSGEIAGVGAVVEEETAGVGTVVEEETAGVGTVAETFELARVDGTGAESEAVFRVEKRRTRRNAMTPATPPPAITSGTTVDVVEANIRSTWWTCQKNVR